MTDGSTFLTGTKLVPSSSKIVQQLLSGSCRQHGWASGVKVCKGRSDFSPQQNEDGSGKAR